MKPRLGLSDMLYDIMSSNGRPNCMCVAFQPLCKLPKSMLTNEVILCLVQFGFGWNKLVQLLIRSRNSGGRTVRSLERLKFLFII